MKILKLIVGTGFLGFIGSLVACSNTNPLVDPFNPLAQFEEEIGLIEDYLSENGFTDYDTLNTGIRLVILEQGSGESIEFNDNVQYEVVGTILDETVFKSTIAQVAYDQDLKNLIDSVHVKDNNGLPVLDSNGFQELDGIEFIEGYLPIYYREPSTAFVPEITTHSLGGWYIQSAQTFALALPGLPLGIHEVLERTKIGGSGLVLLPSALGFGRFGNRGVESDVPVIFEIRPVRIR